jgi:hypothetical protein
MIYNVVQNNKNFTSINRAHIMHTQQSNNDNNRCIVPSTGLQVYKSVWALNIPKAYLGGEIFKKDIIVIFTALITAKPGWSESNLWKKENIFQRKN